MSGIGAAIAGGIASAGMAAASGIGNTLVNYGANKDLQHDARVFNSAEAQKQRDWEQYMASTQYQRMVEDMEKAGINPASMSGVAGQPNSVPSGSSASSSAPGFSSNTFGDFNALINSAVQGMFAKDRNAASILAREVQDNAKHGYRMEELMEREQARKARQLEIASKKHDLDVQRDGLKGLDQRTNMSQKLLNNMKFEKFKSDLGHKNYRKY